MKKELVLENRRITAEEVAGRLKEVLVLRIP
jgi:Lhr-like helicase